MRAYPQAKQKIENALEPETWGWGALARAARNADSRNPAWRGDFRQEKGPDVIRAFESGGAGGI